MESIIALRRTNPKHWQARLSCSNCLPHCSSKLSVPTDPELELTFSSFESDNQFSTSSQEGYSLQFPPDPEKKVDKQTDVRSDNLTDRREQSESEADKRASKSEKRSTKADKYPNPIERYQCPLLEKKDKKAESKAGSRRESRAGSKSGLKLESKGDWKRESKAVSRAESILESRAEGIKEDPSRSAKSVKSDFNKDNSAACAAPSCYTDPCFPLQEKIEDVMGQEEKKKKTKPAKLPKPPKPPKESKLDKKSSAKTQKTKPKPKDKDKKKKAHHEKMKRFEPRKLKNNPTFTQIGGSVNHNCCSCLDAISLYIKEFLRFSCSLTTGHPAQDTEFQERVCDMISILRTMCRDCLFLLRYVLRLLFVD